MSINSNERSVINSTNIFDFSTPQDTALTEINALVATMLGIAVDESIYNALEEVYESLGSDIYALADLLYGEGVFDLGSDAATQATNLTTNLGFNPDDGGAGGIVYSFVYSNIASSYFSTGYSIPQMSALLVDYMTDETLRDPIFDDGAQALLNKVAVTEAFIESGYAATSLDDLAILDGVTSDQSTVDAAIALIGSGGGLFDFLAPTTPVEPEPTTDVGGDDTVYDPYSYYYYSVGEAGESMYEAAYLPMDSYGSAYASGEISNYDDDYYYIYASQTGTMYVDLYGYYGSDIDLDLYDAYGNYVTSSSSTSSSESISTYVYAGETYYIDVESFDGYFDSYDLSIYTDYYEGNYTFADDYVLDTYTYSYYSVGEAGESMYDAAYLPMDSYGSASAYGSVTDYDDDYFYFYTTETGTLYVDLYQYDDYYADIDFTIYDSNGYSVGGSYGVDYYESDSIEVSSGEYYYIDVYSFSGSDDYALSLWTDASYDYNYGYGEYESTDYYDGYSYASGTVDYYNDYDDEYYFTSDGYSEVYLYHYNSLGSYADVDIEIYDMYGNYQTGSSDTDGSEYAYFYGNPGETYVVEVEAYSGSDYYDLYIYA